MRNLVALAQLDIAAGSGVALADFGSTELAEVALLRGGQGRAVG